MTAPTLQLSTDEKHIIVHNPPSALGYVRGRRITLLMVTETKHDRERRVHTVGRSIAVSPGAIAFKVAPSEAGRIAREMVRDELVEAFALGAHPAIELTSADRPTITLPPTLRRHPN